ncbi:3-deoxy-D-manno-octulosonic acid kinase [Psychromonas sp. PT13]|uniref:3-deoxy-D-manno-octulosonic acid kinase n=1 Tax=Psychromonas sp. PT13 TaxID=3439547 RepID=UPI003EBD1C43
MIKVLLKNKDYIIYNDELLNENIEQCFSADYWKQKNKIIGSAQGRGTTWFVQLLTMQAALRHYRRGGLFGKIISDYYFFTGWDKSRSIQEFHLLDKLSQSGVNVPQPVAAKVSKSGLCYRADLLCEKIANATDLVDILQQRCLSKLEYQSIGAQIKKMHKNQVNHTDLNIHNILLDDQGKVWIIDFDKCFQQQREGWQKGNLERLLRSFHKEVKKRSINWQEGNWDDLMRGYRV